MKIKRKLDLNFSDAVKQLEFYQFCQVCKIFGVDIVERNSVKEMALDALKNQDNIDLSKTKVRRDFENMTNELIVKYNSYDRKTRRKFDKIMEKVIRGNNKARAIEKERLVGQYNSGVDNLESIENEIRKELEGNLVDNSTTIDNSTMVDNSTTVDNSTKTSMAAVASEE